VRRTDGIVYHAAARIMTEIKRDKERVPVASLRGEVQVFQPMTVLDISHGGAQVETPFRLQLDSLHQFRLSLGAHSVIVKGRIAYCQIGDLKDGIVIYRSGVEFVEPSEHVRQAITEFVDALRAGQQKPPVIDAELAE
jgi:hypothetical protein